MHPYSQERTAKQARKSARSISPKNRDVHVMSLNYTMNDWNSFSRDVVHDDVPDLVRHASEVGQDEEIASVECRLHGASEDQRQPETRLVRQLSSDEMLECR